VRRYRKLSKLSPRRVGYERAKTQGCGAERQKWRVCGLLSEETEIFIPARFVVARALEKKSEKYLAAKN